MDKYKQKIQLYFELRDLPESSRESYYRRMNAFLIYMQNHNKSIDETSFEDIQQYMLHLKNERNLSGGTINNYISAIKFLYTYVLEKEWDSIKVPRMKRKENFPIIPSREEILTLINGTNNLKHRAILLLLYGSGMRVSEVAKLKIRDISSETMSVFIENAKHQTNRNTILSVSALRALREYFKVYFSNENYSSNDYLFPGRKEGTHVHVKTIKNMLIRLRNKLGLDTRISSHTLRHAFSTHSLEDGVDPVFIQQILGHKNIQTTQKYLHMTSKSLMGVKSPVDTQEKSPK